MSYCLILQHDPAYGPGRIIPVFQDFGIQTRITRLDQQEPVPTDFEEVRLLILLGGPQRLSDEGGPRPEWLDREVEAIRPLVEADRPVVGFGLGAQILARAAGARVLPNRTPAPQGQEGELAPGFGWERLTLPFPGGTDPVLFGLHEGTPMLFWHQDAFELPRLPPPPNYDPAKAGSPPPTGNALLASTKRMKNAGFRFKDHLYGFAFHPELERHDIEAIARAHGDLAGSDAVTRMRSETDEFFDNYDRLGARLLGNCVQYFKAYNPMEVVA